MFSRLAQTNLQLYRQLGDAQCADDMIARAAAGYDLMARLFAGVYRASGKPFVAHLVGTASALVEAEAEPDTVIAGLCHAAYTEGHFGVWGYFRRREIVREAIGERAEALVHGYSVLPWSAGALSSYAADGDSFDDDRAQLLLIRVANEIDEHADGAALFEHPVRDMDAGNEAALQRLAAKLGNTSLARQLDDVLAPAPVPAAALPDPARLRRGSYPLASRHLFPLDIVLRSSVKAVRRLLR